MKIEVDIRSIGFAVLLTIVFVVLKLLKVIDWGWVWVFSPMWITAILLAVVLAVLFLTIYIVYKEYNGWL